MTPVALLLAAAIAAGPGRWEAVGAEAFAAGDLDDVLVTAEGVVSLGPEVRPAWRPAGLQYVWSVVPLGDAAYVGVGNGAEVWRVRRDGSAARLWKGEGLEVYALALGPDGHLWAGVSPTGTIVRIHPVTGAADSAPVGDSYVWSIVSAEGALYAATGRGVASGGGRIVRVGTSGGRIATTEIHRSADAHVLSLAGDGRGGLYFGTQGNLGLVGRLDRVAGDSPRLEVLFDPPEGEVTALAVGEGGTLYAASVGAAAGGPSERPSGAAEAAASALLQALASGSGEAAAAGGGASSTGAPPAGAVAAAQIQAAQRAAAAARARAGRRPSSGKTGRLWRLRPGEAAEALFEAEGGVRELRIDGADVLVAALEGGRVWRVHPDGRSAVEIEVEAEAVLDLAGPYIGTGSPAGLWFVASDVAAEGRYASEPIDAGTLARWGVLDWEGTGPILLATRSGNTAEPDSGWSAWSEAYRERFSPIASPPARFLQVRASLRGLPGAPAPALRRVAVSYQARNRPPRIERLEVKPFSPPQPQQAAAAQQAAAQAQMAQMLRAAAAGGRGRGALQALPEAPNPYRSFLVVEWAAKDEDEDDLLGRLEIRGVDEPVWRPFADGIAGDRHVFDGSNLPDGRYELRLTVSDSPANLAGEAREASRASTPFTIDNTPPTVTLAGEATGRRFTARAEILDRLGPVHEIAHSLDAGEWTAVAPVDGVADSPREAARIVLDDLAPGHHTLAVRATDAEGNRGYEKIVFEIREGGR